MLKGATSAEQAQRSDYSQWQLKAEGVWEPVHPVACQKTVSPGLRAWWEGGVAMGRGRQGLLSAHRKTHCLHQTQCSPPQPGTRQRAGGAVQHCAALLVVKQGKVALHWRAPPVITGSPRARCPGPRALRPGGLMPSEDLSPGRSPDALVTNAQMGAQKPWSQSQNSASQCLHSSLFILSLVNHKPGSILLCAG